MNINKSSLAILGIILLPTYLGAMQNDDSDIINKPQQIKFLGIQKSPVREEDRSKYGCNSLFSLSNNFPSWNNISGFWHSLSKCWKNKTEEPRSNISMLPNEIFWHIGSFLDSINILRLSNTNKTLRFIFNENFWLDYMSKVPKAHSQLILSKSLSPSNERKQFFSHLWYCEGHISLAAKLHHPEATVLRDHSAYGAWIGKDQYLCPSGFIRHLSGVIDHDKTDKLKEAERKKIRADSEKNEVLKKRKDEMINSYLRRIDKWKY